MNTPDLNEYATAEHALKYLALADRIPHRTEGEAVLLEFIPQEVERILDLGTGDGRLLALLRIDRRNAEGIALDFSPTMLAAARERFRGDEKIQVVEHNLDNSLPELGRFDVIVSSSPSTIAQMSGRERSIPRSTPPYRLAASSAI